MRNQNSRIVDLRNITHDMLKYIDGCAVDMLTDLQYQFYMLVLFCNLPVFQLAPASPTFNDTIHANQASLR